MQTNDEQNRPALSWTDMLGLPPPPQADGRPEELVRAGDEKPKITPYIGGVDFNNGKDTAGKENKPSPAVVLGIKVSF